MAEVFGLQVGEIPDGWQPVNVIAIVECVELDSEDGGSGAMRLSVRATDSLTIWSALGMLHAVDADLRAQYLQILGEA